MVTRSHTRNNGPSIERHGPESGLKMLTSGMRKLLWIAGFLVFLAGMQLFVFTERTEIWFAWTIDVPLTAAFLGAATGRVFRSNGSPPASGCGRTRASPSRPSWYSPP
ncbi:MAG: hypothetical protein H0W55_05095 [Actinobacteria bacterium]|nr:hypothetical protein [Actinomycetota bacterium]MDQ3533065.1 hypothetical protein [Actinomycetota bacterium]